VRSPSGGWGSAISVPPVVIAGVVQGLEEQQGPAPLGGELWIERVIEFATQHFLFFSHLPVHALASFAVRERREMRPLPSLQLTVSLTFALRYAPVSP
jgi:hypothetical protein